MSTSAFLVSSVKQSREGVVYGGLLRTILSKHIFMGKVQNFHGQTQNSMAKNRTFLLSAHVFIAKTRYALANIFSWTKCNIFMGVFMGKLNCVSRARVSRALLKKRLLGGAVRNRTCTSIPVASQQCPSCNFFRVE